jgi:hypothetical protein
MKTSLKVVLAAALLALTIASCWTKGGETTSAIDTTQTSIDTTATKIDTTGVENDTIVP